MVNLFLFLQHVLNFSVYKYVYLWSILVMKNIFNILGILGITLFFANIPVTDEMMQKGIWEMIIATIFFVFLLKFKKKISKIIATFMLGAYSFYIFALY